MDDPIMADIELPAEYLPEPMLVVDARGTIMQANRSARRLLTALSAGPGQALGALINNAESLPAQLKQWRRARAPMPVALRWRAQADERPLGWQACLLTPGIDGVETRILLRATQNAAPRRFLALNRELAAQRGSLRELQAQRAELSAREARVHAVLAAARVGTWEWDIREGTVHWSRELERAHGLAPGSFGGRLQDVLADVHPDDAARVQAAVEAARAGAQDYHIEYRIVRPDGEQRWLEAKAQVERDSAGVAARFIGVCMDVTARKEAEWARRESEQRFRFMADAAPVMIWVAGTDKQCTYFNRGWLEFTGRPLEQEAGFGWADTVHREDHARCVDTYTQAFDSRAAFKMEYRMRRHDGGYRWILNHGIPRFEADGSFAGYIGSCIDITPRREMEHALRDQAERLAELDQRKDDFLAMLAHELRNPLAPIGAAAQLLRRESRGHGQVEWAAAMISRQVTHMTRLVDDLLDVARITRDRVELQRARVALHEVVAQALETVRPLVDLGRQRVHINLPEPSPVVEADFVRLVQVVGNLLNNAVKYSEPESEVRVSVSCDAAEAVIRVSDQGVGIDPEIMPRIFDLFIQAPDGLARSRGGMGLGLTVARRLVELHGGSIRAWSAGLGQGSEFEVRLPLASAPAQAQGVTAPAESSTEQAAGRRILVVDDHPDIRLAFAALLEAAGHDVEAVGDGAAALEAARRARPEIVILDIGLPGMDGFEVATRLRAEHERDIYLIAFTGYGQPQDVARAEQAGFDYHLLKPGTFASVEALIARCPRRAGGPPGAMGEGEGAGA